MSLPVALLVRLYIAHTASIKSHIQTNIYASGRMTRVPDASTSLTTTPLSNRVLHSPTYLCVHLMPWVIVTFFMYLAADALIPIEKQNRTLQHYNMISANRHQIFPFPFRHTFIFYVCLFLSVTFASTSKGFLTRTIKRIDLSSLMVSKPDQL